MESRLKVVTDKYESSLVEIADLNDRLGILTSTSETVIKEQNAETIEMVDRVEILQIKLDKL